jgi:uncharacterized membrane protein
MKTFIARLVVLFMLVGALSACASSGTNTPASQPASGSAAVTEAPAAAGVAAADSSTAATQAPASGAEVSFASSVLPLLQSRCVNCHGGQRTEKSLDLNSYEGVVAGSENGPVVTAGDAANSPLAQMVIRGKMPKRGPKLTPSETQLIVDWINQGAKNN